MQETERLKEISREVLDHVDRSERRYLFTFIGVVAVQLLFLWGFIQLADFSNRVHVLIFLSLGATYTLIVLGLAALGAHVSRHVRLILRAIEITGSRMKEAG
jgi:hypothetical protein